MAAPTFFPMKIMIYDNNIEDDIKVDLLMDAGLVNNNSSCFILKWIIQNNY